MPSSLDSCASDALEAARSGGAPLITPSISIGKAAPIPKVARLLPTATIGRPLAETGATTYNAKPATISDIIETTTVRWGRRRLSQGPRLAAAIIDTICGNIHQAA